MTIGILGGGQLGYMLALAGYPLGLHFRFLDPSPEAPVGRIAQRVTADYTDQVALEKFSSGLELVTYEFENVPVEAATFLAGRVPVYPPPAALEAAQDRLAEKELFRKLGITTTEFVAVPNANELGAAVNTLGLPAVLKTSRLGYDGKGQWILRTAQDVAKAQPELPLVKLILERFVPFTRELSVLAVRSLSQRRNRRLPARGKPPPQRHPPAFPRARSPPRPSHPARSGKRRPPRSRISTVRWRARP